MKTQQKMAFVTLDKLVQPLQPKSSDQCPDDINIKKQTVHLLYILCIYIELWT